MQAVIFIGLQSSGKSTLFNQMFRYSHLLISKDVVKTRHREQRLMQVCLETQLRFVVDNTNPAVADRQRYVLSAKAAGFEIVGYFFDVNIAECLHFNRKRDIDRQVPDVAIRDAARRLELPRYAEGFDRLYRVYWKQNQLKIEEMSHESI
jgi:predicted kinase